MSCGAMNSCINKSVFKGIDLCREGIAECCKGLESVGENNVRNGIEQIRSGACRCANGLAIVQIASGCNTLIKRKIQKCYQQLCNIRLGMRDIMQNNIKMGSDDIKITICTLEQIVEQMNNYFETSNGSCGCL